MLLSNLLAILWKAPQIIGIIRAITDVIGLTQMQRVLEAIRGAMHDEGTSPNGSTDEPERERLVTRIFRRLAFRTLGVSEEQYADMCKLYLESAKTA